MFKLLSQSLMFIALSCMFTQVYADTKYFNYSMSVYQKTDLSKPILETKNSFRYNPEKDELLPASFSNQESNHLLSTEEHKIEIVSSDFPLREENEKNYTHRIFFGINDGFYPTKGSKEQVKIQNYYRNIYLYPKDLTEHQTYQTELDGYIIKFTIIE